MKYYLVYSINGVPYQVNSYDTKEAQLAQYNKDNFSTYFDVYLVTEIY